MYRFCEALHVGPDVYLDTPIETIDWMLHIHAEVKRHEREQQETTNRQG